MGNRRSKIIPHVAITLFLLITGQTSFAQRNIINVPTSKIVEKNHLFFQEQITISNQTIQSGTVFTWGLGKNFEAGFNLSQVTFHTASDSRIIKIDPKHPAQSPDFLLNIQKGFKFTEWVSLGIGTRIGINIPNEKYDIRAVTFSYINSRFSIPNTDHSLNLGGYYSNYPYTGKGNHWGWMFGLQTTIIKEKLHLIGDFITGHNSISLINTGFQIFLAKQWQLAFAAQFPAPGSSNNHGGLIQIARK